MFHGEASKFAIDTFGEKKAMSSDHQNGIFAAKRPDFLLTFVLRGFFLLGLACFMCVPSFINL